MSFNLQAMHRQLVQDLDLSSDDREWFVKVLDLFKPEHGIRSIALDDIREGLKQMSPDAVPAYDQFRAKLPSAAPFSFLPMSTSALLSVRAGTLAWPGSRARDAAWKWSRFGSKRFFKNPLFLMTRQAADNKLADYLELSSASASQILNHGQTKLYRVGPCHYEQVCSEQYSAWAEVSVVPYIESLYEEFHLRGTVGFEALGPHEFQLDLRWEQA